jgi:hypothetical protein
LRNIGSPIKAFGDDKKVPAGFFVRLKKISGAVPIAWRVAFQVFVGFRDKMVFFILLAIIAGVMKDMVGQVATNGSYLTDPGAT